MRASAVIAPLQPERRRIQNGRAATVLYWALVSLTCAWVLSLPLWPSQDGPLHLYYVNVLKQLLSHQPGPYADTYLIKHRLTPYSAYYYGLLLLNRAVSLEVADKFVVCTCVVAFAASTRMLLRVAGGRRTWAAFLCLPLLLNWPLAMGFLNYSLSVSLCILALAAWCSGIEHRRPGWRALFLLLIAAMMLTHPVPWLVTVCFALVELATRLLRAAWKRYQPDASAAMQAFPLDLATAALACTPYAYLHRFSPVVQTIEPPVVSHDARLAGLLPAVVLPYAERGQHFLQSLGVDVFSGSLLLPSVYRAGIALLLAAALCTAWVALLQRRRQRAWTLGTTWLLFSMLLLPCLLFLPDPLQGRFFFAERLGIVLFVASIAAAASALRGRLGVVLAACSCVLWLVTLGLAQQYLRPAATAIDSLQQAQGPPASALPGLVMRPSGATLTAPGLNFQPDNWAAAHYFRRNGRVLFNTAWLGDPIILVGVRPGALAHLDTTRYESVPWFGSALLPDNDEAADILHKAGFVMMMRQGAARDEHPFAADPDEPAPAPYAKGWTCLHGPADAWYLCTPPTSP